MSNDRLFIKCPCGAFKCLMKYSPVTGLVPKDSEVLDWLHRHGENCVPIAPDLGGNTWFTLHTEVDPTLDFQNMLNADPQ